MRALVFVLGVLLTCVGFSSVGSFSPEAVAAPAAAVPVLEQETDTPSPTGESEPAQDDPEADADDQEQQEQDEGRKKFVLGLVAVGLLAAVYWGRRLRKNRSQQPTV